MLERPPERPVQIVGLEAHVHVARVGRRGIECAPRHGLILEQLDQPAREVDEGGPDAKAWIAEVETQVWAIEQALPARWGVEQAFPELECTVQIRHGESNVVNRVHAGQSCSRSAARRILPLLVFGSRATKSTLRGYL